MSRRLILAQPLDVALFPLHLIHNNDISPQTVEKLIAYIIDNGDNIYEGAYILNVTDEDISFEKKWRDFLRNVYTIWRIRHINDFPI